MSRSRLWIWCLLLWSCQSVSAIRPPSIVGAKTLVLLFLRGEDLFRAEVVTIPEDGSAPVFPSFSEATSGGLPPLTVVALRYRCPIDVLGLSAGTQALRAEPLPMVELPRALGAERAIPGDPAHRDFEPSDASWDAALAYLPIESGHLCGQYGSKLTTQSLSLDPTSQEVHVSGVTRFPDGRALYIGYSYTGQFVGPPTGYLVSASGGIDHLHLSATSSATVLGTGITYLDENGEVVIVDDRCPEPGPCSYIRGVLGQPMRSGLFELHGLDPDGGTWLDAISPSAPGEEIILGRSSSVHSQIFALHGTIGDPVYTADGLGYPEVLRVGRDDLLLVGMSIEDTVVRRALRTTTSTNFQIVDERLPPPFPEQAGRVETPTGVANDPRLGPIIATTFMERTAPKGGALLVHRQSGWERLPSSVAPAIYAGWVAPIGNELILFGGADQDQNRMRLLAYDVVAQRICGGVEVPRDAEIKSRIFWIHSFSPTQLVVFSSEHGNAGLIVESSRAAPPSCLSE
ncbi:MAG: hypothetical protein U1E65_20975 [Myxococcota bacterium]